MVAWRAKRLAKRYVAINESEIMDIFDFEELTAEMLNVTDEQREDDSFLHDKFFDKFEIDFDLAYNLTKHLLVHTVPVEAGLSKKQYHAFVSRKSPWMLMKTEVSKAV